MTLAYFQSYEGYFWEFENEGGNPQSVFETLSIPGGNTIVYETFLTETLDWLSEEGLPRLGSLLAVLAATNPSGKESLQQIFGKLTLNVHQSGSYQANRMLSESMGFLELLAALPQHLKTGNGRQQLIRMLFYEAHNKVGPKKSKALLQEVKTGPFLLIKAAQKAKFNIEVFIRDFEIFQVLDNRFKDVDAIEKAVIGLPKAEAPQLLDEASAAESDKPLLKQLLEDPATFHVASLIPRLWSGLHIKMHHSSPSERPLGGISDLTNKGDFDRLLLSEFANDDDVFLSRIANNEALFIKREVPPEGEKFVRVLLVDSSIKTWGVPKILGFVSALAISTHPKTDIKCRIHVIGESISEMDHTTKQSIVNAVKIPDLSLTAIDGIRAYEAQQDTSETQEIFLMTSQDAIRSGEWKKFLMETDLLDYLVLSDEQGNIDFLKIKNRKQQFLQRVSLPLEQIWVDSPKQQRSRSETAVSDDEFPILSPLPMNLMARFDIKGKTYLLAANRSLHVTRKREAYQTVKGGRMLFQNLSIKGNLIYELQIEGDNYLLYMVDRDKGEIAVLNLGNRKYTSAKCRGFEYLKSVKGEIQLIKPDTGYTKSAEILRVRVDEEFKLHLDKTNSFSEIKPKKEPSYSFAGSNVLKNLMPVGINNGHSLQFSRFQLIFGNKGMPFLENHRGGYLKVTAVYDKGKFIFPDGSQVITSKRGIATLASSNPDIPRIYLPLSVDWTLAFSTDEYFAGNEYFFEDGSPLKEIDPYTFRSQYYEPFIQHILDHAAQHPSK